MELIEQLTQNWQLLAVAFSIGGAYFQAKWWIKRITESLDRSSQMHQSQNAVLDHIHSRIDIIDRRTQKIEDSVEELRRDNVDQSIKIAVLESKQVSNQIEFPLSRGAAQ